MNFIFGLVCLAIVIYAFLCFRPKEKESLIIMALSCVAASIHITTQPAHNVFVALLLTVLQIAMVVCCVISFKYEYQRRKKAKRKMVHTTIQNVKRENGRVTA